MNKDTIQNSDALFAAWDDDRRSNTPRPLKYWLEENPDHSRELLQWAANAPVLDYADQYPRDEAGEKRALAIGREVVAEMRARYTTAPAPVNSLIAVAKSKGVTPKALAGRLGVGQPILAKLEARLLRFASIPEELIHGIAETLEVTAAQIRDYLRQPATLSSGASYKADHAPQVAPQEDFTQAIRDCPDMAESQKAFWLDSANSQA